MYGDEIEEQLEVRKSIDYIFEETKGIIWSQFFIYMRGFLIQFIL